MHSFFNAFSNEPPVVVNRVDELHEAGLHTVPSLHVRPPRIDAADWTPKADR